MENKNKNNNNNNNKYVLNLFSKKSYLYNS